MATILIVDDRPTNRDVLVTLLKHKGHRLLEAADGVEALERARAERPDLIITDILMPTMDGYEFVRRLRVEPALAQTSIIFYTAHYLEQEAQALARACGVNHILMKPSKPQVILQTVEAALDRPAPPVPPAPPAEFEREHIHLLTGKLSRTVDELQAVNAELRRRAEELEREVAERRQAEQTAQQRAERVTRLYNLTVALAEALTPGQVAEVVMREGVPGLGARAGLVILLSEDRNTLQVIGSTGYPPEQLERWSIFPVTAPIPLADAVRLGQPILLAAPGELQARYAHLAPDLLAGQMAGAAIPLIVEERVIGAIGLNFAERRDFGPEAMEFMLTLAGQCAQALERARLYAAEAWARDEAELARLHLAVLAEAGKRLALSLDEETTLAQLQEMVVPAFADQCFIDLLIETKTVRRVLHAGTDPRQAHLKHSYELRYPADPHYPDHPVLQVIRTGEARLMPELTEAQLPAFAYDAAQLELIRQLGPKSGMIVPLTAQGCTFGAVSFIWAGSGRRYDPADLILAKDLANRTALALNNAHLYRQALTEIAERKRAEEALQKSEQRVRRKLDSILSPEGDIGNLELADIIDAGAIQALMDDFYALAHIPMSIIDLKGQVLVGVGWQRICTRFHRVHPDTCEHCLESDTQLSKDIPPGEFKLYKCKNNLWDIATPIVVGGQHVGNLFSGQFFFDDELPDYEFFRSQARQYGFNEKEYMAAREEVPRLS
ncbi:MAG: PocR ligand-binding domain-containing protein, partial [Chloroflexota bacterium]